jgi:hypothetical protein
MNIINGYTFFCMSEMRHNIFSWTVAHHTIYFNVQLFKLLAETTFLGSYQSIPHTVYKIVADIKAA